MIRVNGAKLRELRERQGLSVRNLADGIHKSEQVLIRMENGNVASASLVLAVSRYFQVPQESLRIQEDHRKTRYSRSGIIRTIDELGRITLPKEMRDCGGFEIGDVCEITYANRELHIRKVRYACMACGKEEGLVDYRGITLCPRCVRQMAQAAQTAGQEG